MSFDDILREFRRCRYVIAACTLLGVGAAIAYWSAAPEEFESFARVLVLPKDPAMASATRQSETYDQEDVSDDLLATHIEIIRSDTIVEAALNREELGSLTSIAPHLKEGQTVTEYIIGRLWTHQGGEDNGKDARIINVGFRHFDPDDARRVVQAVVGSYQSFLAEQFQNVTSEATSLISQAQDQLEQEIETLESEHLDLRRQGPVQVMRGDQISNIHEDIFANIETEIAEIRIRLADAQSRLKAILDAKAEGDVSQEGIAELSFIDENDAARLSVFTDLVRSKASQPAFLVQQPLRAEVARAEYDRLVSLRAEERTLLEDFGSKHPDVTKVRNEIAVLEEALGKRQDELDKYESVKEIGASELLAAYTRALQYDVAVMTDRLAELRTMASQEEMKAKELVNFELRGEVLSSRIDRKQMLYDAVVSRLHDVSLRSNFGRVFNEVLVPPKLGKRVWPRLSICGIAGAAAGFLLGAGITLVTFLASKRFRTIGEMSRGLPVPVLASIPCLEGSRMKWRMGGRRAKDESARANWSRLLDLQFANRSSAAVAVRGLRNAVLLGGKRSSPNLVLVTSPQAEDGKSVIAANLALSIAQAGRSVLLIDTQIDRPYLHNLFGDEAAPGLGDVLEGRVEPFDAMTTPDTHLRLLPAGELRASEADVYQSDRFAQFCELIRERFEFVVFDGPSTLGGAEAQALGSLVDQVLLVTRVSRNTRAEIVTACCEIERHGGHVAGAVANAWDAASNFASDTADFAVQETWQPSRHSLNGHATNGQSPPEIQTQFT